jgi:hypothetical protein
MDFYIYKLLTLKQSYILCLVNVTCAMFGSFRV